MTNAAALHDPPVEVLDDPERASALLDRGRRRLLRALRERPDSAAGLARRLGESRQRLNYHLRVLEEAEFLEVAEERPRGNFTERVFRVVPRRFVVDPGACGAVAAEPEEMADRFSSAYLVALAARTIREVGELQERAEEAGKRLATASLETEVRVESPAAYEAFVRDLGEAVAEVVSDHHSDAQDARPFRLVLNSYQKPPGQEETDGRDPGRHRSRDADSGGAERLAARGRDTTTEESDDRRDEDA